MRHLIVLLGILLLASCFEIREEAWIHGDGSGRLKIDLTIPSHAISLAGGEAGLLRSIEDWFAANPQVELEALSLHPARRNDEQTLVIEAAAPSLQALADLSEGPTGGLPVPGVEQMAGTFDIRVSPAGIDFHRHIDLGEALGLVALAISPGQRHERKLECIIHLPTVSKSHNADEILDGGKTLVWRRTLGQALAGPVEMRFQAPLPYPLLPIALAGLAFAVVGFLVFRRLRRGR